MQPLEYIRREVFRVTQTEMAKIADTTQATVSRWENGELEPDRDQLVMIRNEALKREKEWSDHLFFEVPLAPSPSDSERVAS